MASITGWKCRWPNMTAPSMMSSGSSLASDSTISTASAVPATTRSSSRLGHLVERRIENIFAVDEADARGADRAHEGRAGKGERGGCRDQRDDIGIVFQVVRERRHDHLGFVAPAFGKERTDRAIDQAGDQRLLFGRTAFALEIAAGNAARSVIFFLVVDGERQKIDAFARLLCRDNGREHGGFAIGGKDGAIGLARHAAGLEGELAPAPIEFNTIDIEHFVFLSSVSDEGEAMSKTARGCCAAAPRLATASGDPAMAFIPPGCERASLAPVPFSGGRMPPVEQRTPMRPPQARIHDARGNQRRILSRSISVLVARLVAALDVVEQLAALGHELEQPAARMIVLHMGFEVLGQVVDAFRQGSRPALPANRYRRPSWHMP